MAVQIMTEIDELCSQIFGVLRPDLNRLAMPRLYDEYFEKLKEIILAHLREVYGCE